MRYCIKCGNELDDNVKFCNKCGQQVNNLENNKQETDNIKSNNDNVNSNNVNNKVRSIKPNENKNIGSTIILNKDKIDSGNSNKDINKSNKNINRSNDTSRKVVNIKENNKAQVKKVAEPPIKEERKGINKKIVVVIILGLIIVIGSVLFIFRKDMAYSHYMKKANAETSETSKLNNYNKALKYKYTQELIDNIYEVIRKDDDFSERTSNITNLKKEDSKKLIKDSAIFRAKSNFDSGNYKACMENLQKAQKIGYNINSFSNYKELVEKLNPQEKTQSSNNVSNNYTYKNDNPSITNKVVNSLGNVYCKDHKGYDGIDGYIIPDSDSRYLSESELQQYDKYTLGLIRNEIYARHGFIFGDNNYRDYFTKKTWYVPDTSFHGDDSEINDYEYYNGRLILNIEKGK